MRAGQLKVKFLKNRLTQIAKIASLLFIGFLAGTVFGFREATLVFYFTDAVPRATIAVGNLRQLEQGNAEPIKVFLNTDINLGLYYYSLAKDEWWFPLYKNDLFVPGFPGYSYKTDLVKKLANYRKRSPGPYEDPTMFDVVPQGKEEHAGSYSDLAVSHRDRLTRIKSVIDQYSSK